MEDGELDHIGTEDLIKVLMDRCSFAVLLFTPKCDEGRVSRRGTGSRYMAVGFLEQAAFEVKTEIAADSKSELDTEGT